MSRAVNRIIREKLGRFTLDRPHPIQPRELDLGEPVPPREGNPVTAIAGARRSGKTHRLLQEMERLVEMGVSPERLCYFDFDDDRLESVTPQTGHRVIETFLARSPRALEEGSYLFLDGIDAMSGWRGWLMDLAARRRVTVYVAGLLTESELRSSGKDRTRRIHRADLHPYSFAEYRRIVPDDGPDDQAEPADNEMRFAHRNPLTRYLTGGGFPEVIGLSDERRVAVLQDLAASAVLRDVVELGDVSRPRLARDFAHRVFAANGEVLSLRKVVQRYRSAGLKVEREELEALLRLLAEARLALPIPYVDVATEPVETGYRKVYAADPGMARACARVHGNNISFLLENAIYLELLRRTSGSDAGRVRCLKNQETGHEVDFLTGDPLGDGPSALYQVTWSIAPERVRWREIRAILEVLDRIARLRGDDVLPQATIVIGDATPESLAAARDYLGGCGGRANRIRLAPADRWLLGDAGEWPSGAIT